MMSEENHNPAQLLSEALATNMEAISTVPKAGDTLLTLAKKGARLIKSGPHSEGASLLAQKHDITTADPEMYGVAASWPHVISKEGGTGVVAIRATCMAMHGNAHTHNMGDVARLLDVLNRIPGLLKTNVTPFDAWAIYQPIAQVIQSKLDYMVSRAAEPKTAPSTPTRPSAPDVPNKRPRGDEPAQGH